MPTLPRLRIALMDEIAKDRNGEHINRDMVKACIRAFVDIGLEKARPEKPQVGAFYWVGERKLQFYEENFEKDLIAKSAEEFEHKARKWINSDNCFEYLKRVDDALSHEEKNADFWLQPETKAKILTTVERELISKKAETVLDKQTGCQYMFENQLRDQLALLYKCFRRDENTLHLIILRMNPYIEDRGQKIVTDEALLKDPKEFSRRLLDLKQEMDDMITQSFLNDLKFQRGRDASFSNFMSECSATPNYLAAYADHELRRGIKGLSNEETDARLDAIVRLYCCLSGRDMFNKAYA